MASAFNRNIVTWALAALMVGTAVMLSRYGKVCLKTITESGSIRFYNHVRASDASNRNLRASADAKVLNHGKVCRMRKSRKGKAV